MLLLADAHEPVEELGLLLVCPVLGALAAAVDIKVIRLIGAACLAPALEGLGAEGGVDLLALHGGGGGCALDGGEGEGGVGRRRGGMGGRGRGRVAVVGGGLAGVCGGRADGLGEMLVSAQGLAQTVLVEGGLSGESEPAHGSNRQKTHRAAVEIRVSALLQRHMPVLHRRLAAIRILVNAF